ncbi:hypothetical protein HYG86_07040 [Alkalicella caledoniensis]|uniref:Uncharacterized protein n=1 Tax=Alkalicella caledoniensis TaxID=2731377 RepID=A0A7G9W790_ALKCA|nr:hypothetical protein [Alkalicella caledoniensis]QNO14552.1 hypothetical protein HYG86_07040 [Alkalicella caledoniensis]
MKWLKKLQTIDSKIIYLVLFFAIALPLIFPIGIPVEINAGTRTFYDTIDNLPKGSVILISYDWDAASAPELLPQATAITKHALTNGHKIVALGLWYAGPTFADRVHNAVAAEVEGKEYGVDFVNLGYRPGGAVVLNSMARDFHQTFPEDVNRTRLSEIPLMKEVKDINDIDLIIDLSAGDPGYRAYIEQIGSQYNVPILVGCTAVSVSGITPYLQSGNVGALLGGLRAAAEYELLIDTPGLGLGGMDAQSVAHLTIIAFIIVGNIAYIATKKKK